MTKFAGRHLIGIAVLGLVLAGCDEVSQAVDQANNATSKAAACTEALGIANFDPNVNPEQLQAEAGEKATKLRELGNQVAEQDVQQTLFAMADSYVELEQRKTDQLGNVNDWLQRSLTNLEQLQKACL
ncbi:hypothetical protein [Amycolatopsis albispora]|uniref:Uncharacterized protein n=1 Tax=Amycolatopsis albispora TaxID=1804986 RepID=A0A344LCG6_9PSEU|nr:hypothetical protein [Amycolatopsis albispora]AXB45740.1 hypothetical protein A4R43_27320 [Amycolatopsis albispora]